MPLPKPKPKERYNDFTKRFMTDPQVKKEFPEVKQRFAVMVRQWRSK